MRRRDAQRADDVARIGIKQELVRIEAMPLRRRIGSMDAIAVERARSEVGNIAVPDTAGVLGESNALALASPL
jgi:hypothetical protein